MQDYGRESSYRLSELFSGLDASEIASITQLLIERRYEADEMLFWEGDPCAGRELRSAPVCGLDYFSPPSAR